MFVNSQKIIMLEPRFISPSPSSARRDFNEYELAALKNSIAENGIIVPLCVRELGGGRYSVISGERRLIAARMAGLKKVPCIVKKTDDVGAAVMAISENTLRSGLDFFETARAIERLIKVSALPECEVAERLGISQSAMQNKVRLLKLDQILQQRIISAGLCERQARLLLKLPPEKREAALDKIISDSLNTPQTEALVKGLLSPEGRDKKPIRKAAVGSVKIFGNSLLKLVEAVKLAGFTADTTFFENEDFAEYTVRFKKTPEPPEYYQLPFL